MFRDFSELIYKIIKVARQHGYQLIFTKNILDTIDQQQIKNIFGENKDNFNQCYFTNKNKLLRFDLSTFLIHTVTKNNLENNYFRRLQIGSVYRDGSC